MEKDVTTVAFLKRGVTSEEILAVEEAINRLDHVENYEFKSKKKLPKK